MSSTTRSLLFDELSLVGKRLFCFWRCGALRSVLMVDIWTAFYWGDYLKDTAHLSPEQHGCYILLLAHYYSTREAIPADLKMIYRICKCMTKNEEKSTRFILQNFFSLFDGKYYNTRAEKELNKKVELSNKRREAVNNRYKKNKVSHLTIVPTIVGDL